MAKHNHVEFRVGLITLVGFGILLASLYWLQGYKMERNAQRVKVLFEDVGSLSAGDRVTVSGVHKGKVDNLRLTNEGVLVELLVYQDVELRQDAQFVIKNLGVMGERFIAVSPGRAIERFDLARTVSGQAEVGLPDIMGNVGEVVVELRNMVSAMRQTVASDTSLARFNRTVGNLESLSRSLTGFMTRNEEKWDKTASNFLKTSEEMTALVERNAGKVDSTISRFHRATVGLDTLVYQLDTLSGEVRFFADQLNNGDGTLQLMMQDRRLYDDLRGTADNIDLLINDIRSNPSKYINLKVEIF
ncbi:MAG: MlaD family protein [candidate division Zixibacteria bacterium]|nr:MlaD family protein [candidate division Zixibacteria bacterium]